MVKLDALTVTEASRKYGYNEEHLRRLARVGDVEADKLGTVWLIDEESLRAHVAAMRAEGKGPRK